MDNWVAMVLEIEASDRVSIMISTEKLIFRNRKNIILDRPNVIWMTAPERHVQYLTTYRRKPIEFSLEFTFGYDWNAYFVHTNYCRFFDCDSFFRYRALLKGVWWESSKEEINALCLFDKLARHIPTCYCYNRFYNRDVFLPAILAYCVFIADSLRSGCTSYCHNIYFDTT